MKIKNFIMINSPFTFNYISHFTTNYGVYHTYHSNIIIFTGNELSKLIFPGLLYELKTHTKWPEIFDGVISSPSQYKLPSYLFVDKLIEELRNTLAEALIFIHTWINEHPSDESNGLINAVYDTYEDFFIKLLSFIIMKEPTQIITEIAIDLKYSIKRLKEYLGPYHGNLKYSIYKIQDVTSAVILLFYFMYLFTNINSTT